MDYDAVPNTLAPFHRWCCPYSTRHIRLPKSGCPNIAFSNLETPPGAGATCDLWVVWPNPTKPIEAGIQCAYEYDLCSPHPTKFWHLRHRKFARASLDIAPLYRLPKRGSDMRVLQTRCALRRVIVWWPCRLSFIFRNFHTDFSGSKLKSCAESA